jgi:uncharacterized protein involved in exopolysaccharide biosynthesis
MRSSYVAPVTETPSSETLSLVGVINFVLRNIVLMVVVGAVFGIALGYRASRAPVSYTARTSFITEGEQPAGRLILGGITMPSTGGRGPEFYVELMQSPAILGPLVEKKFEAEPGKPPKTLIERYGGSAIPTQAAREAAMGTVGGKLSTKISVNSVVSLRVTAETPLLAASIARGVLDEIDAFNDRRRKEIAIAERKFAEAMLLEVGAELRVAEARLLAWDERNRGGSSPALRLERDHIADVVGVKRGLYSGIVQAHEKAKLDEERDSPRATVLERAEAPLRPNRPAVMRYVVLGVFFGAMLAAMYALAREYFGRLSKQVSPEALEFTALRDASTERLRKPINAVIATLRKPSQLS